VADRRYSLNFTETVYEDTLPEDMTDADYAEWFSYSRIDGVRVGPGVSRVSVNGTAP